MAQAIVNDSEIIPIADFAKRLRVHPQTIKDWQDTGRLNHDRTRRVKIQLVKMPYGYGISNEVYAAFIRALNDR